MKKLSDFKIKVSKGNQKTYEVYDREEKFLYETFEYEYEANNYIKRACMKPCPYCGEIKVKIEKTYRIAGHGEGYEFWQFYCETCRATIFTAPASDFYCDKEMTMQEAITKYNTRYQPRNRKK